MLIPPLPRNYSKRPAKGQKPWVIARQEYFLVHACLPADGTPSENAATVRRGQWWVDAVLKARG